MSMHHGRASFPTDCSICSKRQPGPCQGSEPRHVLQGKARVSMSVPACAACGAERRSKLCFKTTRPEVLPLTSRQMHLDTMFLFCSNGAWTIELMKSLAKSAL